MVWHGPDQTGPWIHFIPILTALFYVVYLSYFDGVSSDLFTRDLDFCFVTISKCYTNLKKKNCSRPHAGAALCVGEGEEKKPMGFPEALESN